MQGMEKLGLDCSNSSKILNEQTYNHDFSLHLALGVWKAPCHFFQLEQLDFELKLTPNQETRINNYGVCKAAKFNVPPDFAYDFSFLGVANGPVLPPIIEQRSSPFDQLNEFYILNYTFQHVSWGNPGKKHRLLCLERIRKAYISRHFTHVVRSPGMKRPE
ncbi:Uncharacterized protein TCM_034199 [Theobroma cacao]|uniref:Uncharacterized protein n=1 Tax=Theobroma cacao TaxID=3641 RepID=A0A061FDJ9_THECC|nr:Uncharacterized protein TCM_034199 [Theobroma cacao]